MSYKIMIGINTLDTIEQPSYSNHLQFFFRLGRNTDHTFAINTPRRMSIDRMRNMTAKLALESEFDYVMFIDDDVVIPINCLQRMLDADKDIVAGWTIIRGHPFQNMFFRYKDDSGQALEHYQDPVIGDNGLIECDAVGFSCVLIKCSLLKKINPPYFVTGPNNTEDIYFCIKAKQLIPNVTIVVDSEIKTYHNIGPEYVGPVNRDAYKEYREKAWPEMCIPDAPADRGENYLEMVKKNAAN